MQILHLRARRSLARRTRCTARTASQRDSDSGFRLDFFWGLDAACVPPALAPPFLSSSSLFLVAVLAEIQQPWMQFGQ